MKHRDEFIFFTCVLAIVLTVIAASSFQSEFYFFFPSKFPELMGPPSDWTILISLVMPICVFLSRMRDRLLLALFAIPPVAGLPVGVWFYGWHPGIAHYIIMAECLCLSAFVWRRNNKIPDYAE